MRRKVLLFALLLVVSASGLADERSESEIKELARSVLQRQAASRGIERGEAEDLQIVEQTEGISIVANSKNGFAVITNDDGQIPVVGYSFSAYDAEKVSDGFQWWMQAVTKAVSSGIAISRRAVPSEYEPTVAPILKTTWNQNEPYNLKCPVKNGEHCLTGCVATALAQVLYYYRYPLQGTGSHNGFDFASTIFEWGNMQYDKVIWDESGEDYTFLSPIQKDAVATLMYACGKAVDMNYGIDASAASYSNAVKALKDYFGYENPQYYIRSSYTGDWMSAIYNELSNSRPVMYEGNPSLGSDNKDGHAFILDGYDTDGNVHVNWGWGGLGDGYFNLDVLEVLGDDYSADQGMIINIRDYVAHPEMSSDGINISGSREAGATHSVTATITNHGTSFSGPLYLFVSQNPTSSGSLQSQQQVSIEAGATASVTVTYTPTADGNYYLWLTADNAGKDIVGKIGLSIGADEKTIEFKDKVAENACLYYFDTNYDNALSFKEAAAVTDLEQVGNALFYISSFDELQYFTSLKTIPATTFFDGCNGGGAPFLKSITFPASLKSIDEEAFWMCPELETVTFDKDSEIETIANSTFLECEKLNTVILPNSLKKIDELAFGGCAALESIELPPSLTTIGTDAFADCSSLKSITFPSGMRTIGERAFNGCGNLKQITMEVGLQKIEERAFEDCESLEEIELPEGLTTIEDQAFYNCNNVKKIVFPTSVKSIGYQVFRCDALEDVYVKWTENPYVGDGWEFARWDSNWRLHIPKGTKGMYQSYEPWKSFEIMLEEGAGGIDFADATAKAICVENWDTDGDGELSQTEAATVKKLDKKFVNTEITSFDELKYFTGLHSIYNEFTDCAKLKSIVIPSTLTDIDDFDGCSELVSIQVENNNWYLDSRDNCNAVIYTYENKLLCGCKATVIPNTVDAIGGNAFKDCVGLTSIEIPNSVKTMGHNAFSGCI